MRRKLTFTPETSVNKFKCVIHPSMTKHYNLNSKQNGRKVLYPRTFIYVKNRSSKTLLKIFKLDQCFMASKYYLSHKSLSHFSLSCGRYDSLSQDNQIQFINQKPTFKRKEIYHNT